MTKLFKIQYTEALKDARRSEQGFSVENIFSIVAVEPKWAASYILGVLLSILNPA
jgi:hypothetical protein